MIKTNNLSKYYAELTAVDNVSFEIGSGEIVGLLGHNGAGKTTIMKMLTGFLEPSSGCIIIDNLNIAENLNEVQAKIGYLAENCPLYLDMSVIGYLDYAAGLRGLMGSESNRAVRDAIDKTMLTDKATQTISTLSRGYRQRVGVAQAILNRPEILILDEPTNGLDPTQIQQMRDMIIELGKHSIVILSTHIMQEVHAVCDRVLIIRNGRLALDSTLADLEKGRRLLLTVDRTPDIARGKIAQINGVRSVQHLFTDGQLNQYGLEMNESSIPIAEAAAPVAKALVDMDFKVYALTPEKRDLEAVFSEINSSDSDIIGGQINAA